AQAGSFKEPDADDYDRLKDYGIDDIIEVCALSGPPRRGKDQETGPFALSLKPLGGRPRAPPPNEYGFFREGCLLGASKESFGKVLNQDFQQDGSSGCVHFCCYDRPEVCPEAWGSRQVYHVGKWRHREDNNNGKDYFSLPEELGIPGQELKGRLDKLKNDLDRRTRSEDRRSRSRRGEPRKAKKSFAEGLYERAADQHASGATLPKDTVREEELEKLLRKAFADKGDEETDFPSAPPRAHIDLAVFARRYPGVLLQRALQEMQRYLAPLGGASAAASSEQQHGKITQYLISVFFQRYGVETIGIRNVRELRTISECLDALLDGDLPRLGDVLVQRFKALETAVSDGGWSIARHQELIPSSDVGLASERERAAAMRIELDRVKLAEAATRAKAHDVGAKRRSREEGARDSDPCLGDSPMAPLTGELHELGAAASGGKTMGQLGRHILQAARRRGSPYGECVRRQLTGQLWQGGKRQRDVLPLPVPWGDDAVEMAMEQLDGRSLPSSWHQGRDERARLAGIGSWVILVISALNFLYAGADKLVDLRRRAGPANQSQIRALEKIKEACTYHVDRRSEETGAFGRSPKIDFDQMLGRKRLSYEGHEVSMPEKLTLQELLPGLPPRGEAASVDPLEFASEEVVHALLHPELVCNVGGHCGPQPPAKVHAEAADWDVIVKELLERGVLEEIPHDAIARVGGQPILNGAFGVVKSGTPMPPATRVLRLIINMVPSNRVQVPILGDIKLLPVGGEHHVTVIEDGELLVWSSEDIKGCFHVFKLPACWRPWMALSRPVAPAALGRATGPPIWVSVAAVPMGWLSAVGIVQHLTRRIVTGGTLTNTSLDESAELRRDARFPLRLQHLPRMWWKVYIDNVDIAEVMVQGEAEDLQGTLSVEQVAVRDALAQWGIRRNEDKTVERSFLATSMGSAVDGRRGRVSPTFEKLLLHLALTCWVLARPDCKAIWLAAAAGRWCFDFGHRRPAFGAFDRIWKEMSEWRGRHPISRTSGDELYIAMAISPLLFADLRAVLHPEPLATDASEYGGGTCVGASLTPKGWAAAQTEAGPAWPESGPVSETAAKKYVVHGLLRQADHRGSDVRLDLGLPFRPSAWPRAPIDVERWQWQTVLSHAWRRQGRHINELELAEVLLAVKWFCRRADRLGSRVAILVDSQVTLAVCAKGRSSSRRLNHLLRRLDAYCLAAFLWPFFGYVASKANPADGPRGTLHPAMSPKQVAAATRKAGRAASRASLGKLQDQVVTAGTLARYRQQVKGFLIWRSAELDDPSVEADLDEQLMAYIEVLWAEGDPKAYANDLVAGIQHFMPRYRRALNGSWRLLGAWARAELPVRAPPLSKKVALGIAGYAAVQRSYALGVLWLVGFHCCLRSGEMFALRAGDIIFGQGSNYAVLNLRLTKTGARQGAQESVTISDSIVAAHLQRVVRDLPPGQLVCSLSGPSQRQIFREICRELQLDEHGYGMYSFRRGSAWLEDVFRALSPLLPLWALLAVAGRAPVGER
ncbi:unnamed protein product, partial [Prorocentrum cordatum]